MKIPFRSNALHAGLALAALHLLLIGSIYLKFQLDRAMYPRVWIQTQPYDPDLPIRGRYVSLSPVVSYTPDRDKAKQGTERLGAAGPFGDLYSRTPVRLEVRDGVLTAIDDPAGRQSVRQASCRHESCAVLSEPIAFFIPEHANDPSRRATGEELWVEATIPPTGPPRPIRLGVKANGNLKPLDIAGD